MRERRAGFHEVKRRLVASLQSGRYQYEARGDIDTKNLLAVGAISPEALCEWVKGCNGTCHTASPHHADSRIEVHVLRRAGWYVKFYFIDPDTVFISVHQ